MDNNAAGANGFKYEVQVSGCGDKWHKNGVTFATAEEAEKAGRMKWMTWSMCENYRVVPTEEIPNYRWTDAGIEHIDTPSDVPVNPEGAKA